jgi:hypothetical protein
MNLGGLFDFILKRLMGRAINAGIDRVISGGKDRRTMTPDERAQHDAARQTARRARQASRLASRIMKR